MSISKRSRDDIAKRVAQDMYEGAYVNLGIGLPTLVANHLPPGREILLHSENGILGMGPKPPKGEEDWDLMFDINVRGTFMMSRACIPWLKKSTQAHILNLSPPLNMDMKWFSKHLAYTISKYDMTMIALGLAAELKNDGIAANTLWPKTTIATAAVQNLLGGEMLMKMSRTPAIIADAAYYILSKSAAECSGNSFTDEAVLAAEGITDLSGYSVVPGATLYTDLFV